ncbi:MAG: hypothetical protein RL094_632 [Candidatus Parcubacteria bacterium]|jgi:cell division protein FtsB
MREFQEKHEFRKRLYSKTTLLILVLVLVLLGRGVINVYKKEKASRAELERVAAEQLEIQKRYSVLAENSDRLKTSDGIETEIRSKFDVAKAGEGVIVVVDKPVPKAPEAEKSVIQKIWNSVRNVFRKDSKIKP